MIPSLALVLLGMAAFLPAQEKAQEKPAQTEAAPVDPATAAFAALMEEIKSMSPKTPAEWEEKKAEFIAAAKAKLQEFAKTYPNADEGYEARMQLAQIAAEVDEDLDLSAKILEGCVKDLSVKPEERKEIRAKALFLLAQTQITANRFADARKNLNAMKELLPGSPFAQAAVGMLQQLDAMEKLAIGNPVIPFEAPDLDGKKVSPKSFEGKVLLLDFWATWCGPCKRELPNVQATYDELHAKGFEILAVSLDESEEKLRTFVKDKKMLWPQCFDGKGWENEIAALYGIKSIPATFLIDRAGKLRFKNLRGEELKKRVAELLAEEIPAKK